MAFNNIPGIRAQFGDQFFNKTISSDQPLIVAVGFASSGSSYKLRNAANISTEDSYYGLSSELMRGVHELFSQGSQNIATLRIGGSPGEVSLTDSSGGTLSIKTERRDNAVLSRYHLIVERNSDGDNRYLVYDIEDSSYIFDSEEIKVIDTGMIVVVDSNFGDFNCGDSSDPTDTSTNVDFASLAPGSFTDASGGSATVAVTLVAGSDGDNPSLVARYAALSEAYELLDNNDLNMVYPVGVFIDDLNIIDDTNADVVSYGYFGKGIPYYKHSNNGLGYLWQYRYQGKVYTYFTDSATYFTDVGSAAAATASVLSDVVLTALAAGKGGNAFTFQATDTTGAASITCSITETAFGVDILVDADSATHKTDAAQVAVQAAIDAFTLKNGVSLSTLIACTGGSVGQSTAVEAKANLTGGTGPNPALSHEDLTGDTVPATVTARWAAGADGELREANFYHQALSFCDRISRSHNMVMTAMNFKRPPSAAPSGLGAWVGDKPLYSTIGEAQAVDAVADNGNGILGNKFFAGKAATSTGYRSALVAEGNSTDGYAFGGLIKTKGTNLPVDSDWAYGINDGDEEAGFNSAPVDIGRYGVACAGWPVHQHAFNGSTAYRGPQAGLVLGLLASLPENIAPIGRNGAFSKISNRLRLQADQVDSLASLRITSVSVDSGALINVKGDTSAHPDSDYNKVTTVRCLSRQLAGVRGIVKQYIGKPFTSVQLLSMKNSIEGFLTAERTDEFNNGFSEPQFEVTQLDRILGNLTVVIRLVPPFSIEAVTLRTSLAADETDL
jgi:hypothetical protein